MSGPLYQADSRWGSIVLGDGPSTIGKSGCLLVCLVEAARYLGTRPDMLPPHLNEACRQRGCFFGASLVVRDAAPLVGLVSPDAEKVTSNLADQVVGMLGGGLAVLHVDHDDDPQGDHFLLAVKVAQREGMPPHVECYDPATGVPVWLSLPDLEATARWGKVVKRYRTLSARPIRKAA